MEKWKDDIEKYRSGKLTTAERHALEKKALNDPFLADAFEGADEIPFDVFSDDVGELNKKILGKQKNRWLWPLRIAASVIGIALISTIIIYSNTDPTENLTSNEEQKNVPAAGPKADSLIQPQEQAGDTAETEAEKKNEEIKKLDETLVALLKEKKPQQEKPNQESLTQQLAGAGGESLSGKPLSTQGATGGILTVTDTISSAGLPTTTDPAASIALSEEEDTIHDAILSTALTPQPRMVEKEESKMSRAKTAALISLVAVNGVVRDQQGQPIPGVNIVAKGSTAGTVTNAEGKYSIKVPSEDQTLVYSFIGYEAQEQSVKKSKDGNLDVKLEEDATQLSEVVVTGYGDKRDTGEPVVRLAEPVGGRKAYDQYLEEKKMYPMEAIENKVEGKVTIEFTVGVTGILSDFQITRKLGYGCDEEVIRLVKAGPQWKPSYIDNEAVESLVRIKTRFKLPGK